MSRTTRRPLFLVLACVSAAAALAGCGAAAAPVTTTASSPQPGGTANIPLAAEPRSLLPYDVQDSESGQIAHEIFQGLVKYELQPDGTMRAVPDIAESWNSNEDLTVWTFKLRRGVTFQPPVGGEVTAADFVACFNIATDPANGSYTSYLLAPIKGVDDSGYAKHGVTGMKALDPYTLRFTLTYPYAEFPQTLGTPVSAVWPVDYFRSVGKAAFGEKPVGTGPYLLETWKHSQYVDLVRNDSWWDKASGGPYLERVHMPVFLDTNIMWLAFEKGDLDYTVMPTGQEQSSREAPQVKNGEWTAKVWPQLAMDYVGINMRDPRLGGDANLPLRQALSYALDRKAIISLIDQGVAAPATGLVPVGIPGAGRATMPYEYDPEKARTIVQGLGALDTFAYWYNTNERLGKLGEAYQAAWQAVGIPVKLSNFEFSTYAEKIYNKGEGELFYLAWGADYPSMDSFLYGLFESSRSGWASGTGYSNAEVDRLLHEARRTAGEARRLDLYTQAEQLILNDVPVIPMESGGGYRVTNNRLGGLVYDPLGRIDLWKVWVK